jgi:hypothetical protein
VKAAVAREQQDHDIDGGKRNEQESTAANAGAAEVQNRPSGSCARFEQEPAPL